MAGGKRIPVIDEARRAERALRDLGTQLDRAQQIMSGFADKVQGGLGAASDRFEQMERRAGGLVSSFGKLAGTVGGLWGGFDKLGKSLLALDASIIGLGIGLLIKGIQRVYELQERWAKVTGMVTMKIGALTPGVDKLIRTSRQWQGTIRGLTDDFELGAQMFTEYAATLETTGKHVEEFSRLGLQLARGFDLGGKGAGELLKTFRAIGAGGRETSAVLVRMTKEAGLAGVNTQQIVKELSESSDMMAEFGRAGAQGFLRATVYLRQFNVSLRDMQRFMEVFDTFDSATEAAAKLNTIFGTTVSSMDMLLEQDPSARFEMVRRQLLSQGKTFEQLSRYERKTLADTLKLSEREVAFMLDASKAHVTLAGFREQAAKQEVSEREAQKKMEMQLRKTAQTLFAFGAAMDRITLAIAKALRPLLEELGLVKKNSKEWKSFADVMGGATDVIVRFFEGLAKSPQWMKHMKNLAGAMRSFGKWAASLTVDDFAKAFDKIVTFAEKFAKWSGIIIALWAGSKAVAMVANLGKVAASIGSTALSGAKSILSVPGKLLDMTTTGTRASFTGHGKEGPNRAMSSTTGFGGGMQALGGMLGLAGIGVGIIGLIGPPIVEAIVDFFKSETTHEKKMRVIREEREQLEHSLNQTIQRSEIIREKTDMMLQERARKQSAFDETVMGVRKKVHRGRVDLDAEERATLKEHIASLIDSGKTNRKLEDLYADLASKQGPIKITGDQFRNLQTLSKQYQTDLQNLSTAAQMLAQTEMDRLQVESGFGIKRDELVKKQLEADVARDKMIEKNLGQEIERVKDGVGINKAHRNFLDALEKVKKRRQTLEEEIGTIQNKILQQQVSFERKKMALEMRRMIMSDELFKKFMTERGITDIGQAFKALTANRETLGAAGFKMSPEDFASMMQHLGGMAEGGIVTRPTAAMVGEAGPEAIIPLRAMATGSPRFSQKFGGEPARRLVNYASGKGDGSGGGKPTVVAGDVYLDGAKVGRHLVRGILSNSTR